MYRNNKQGFTLIELLVTISIISLLATVLIGSADSIRKKAAAGKIVNDVRGIRGALHFRYSGDVSYPTETQLTAAYPALGANPSVEEMIDEGVFQGNFEVAPTTVVGGGRYWYDADAADAGEYPIGNCGSYVNNGYGVNILIDDALTNDTAIILALDELVDGSDGLDCGKIRTPADGDATIMYSISLEPNLFP